MSSVADVGSAPANGTTPPSASARARRSRRPAARRSRRSRARGGRTSRAATAAAEPLEEPPGVRLDRAGRVSVDACTQTRRSRIADDDGPRRTQERDHGCVGRRAVAAIDRRPVFGRKVGRVNTSLIATGTPSRGARRPRRDGAGRARLRGQGRPPGARRERADRPVVAGDRVIGGTDDLGGAQLPRMHEVHDRRRVELCVGGGRDRHPPQVTRARAARRRFGAGRIRSVPMSRLAVIAPAARATLT